MRYFKRPGAPDCLIENAERWNKEYSEQRRTNPSFIFRWRQHQSKPINHWVREALNTVLLNHCSYCDHYSLGIGSRETIDHFKPKESHPEHAYSWDNLFYCCDQCQCRNSVYKVEMLRPDADDYAFDRYFQFNHTTGDIEPAPYASDSDQLRAKITIELFDFNRPQRRRARKEEVDKFDHLSPAEKIEKIDTYSFRFLFDSLL